jgi:hypothetical protein
MGEGSPSASHSLLFLRSATFIILLSSERKQSAKHPPAFSLVEALHASEAAFLAPNVEPLHKFTVAFSFSNFSRNKFKPLSR